MPGPGTSSGSLATVFIAITIITAAFVGVSYIGTQISPKCLGFTPVPQRPVGNLTPVLQMQPNTIGYVCVTYKAAWAGNPNAFNPYYFKNESFPFMIYIGNNTGLGAFTITASPSSVRLSANVTHVTVLYRVAASANSKGFYDYSAPYGYCDSVPMAVGYDASQINGSDFPPRPPLHSCPAKWYIPASVAVSGINVILVDIPASRSYMTAPTETSFCTVTTPNYSGKAPCSTYDRSTAYTFNCTAAATTPSGCTKTLGIGSQSFNVTVWYPAKNQTLPWANCYYVVSNTSGRLPASWGECIAVTPTSFIVAGPPEGLT